MEPTEGARSFQVTGDAYDSFMGRYSRPLAVEFADAAGVAAGQTALDVGCGPGALTTVLVDRLGVDSVWAVDPSPPFVADCAARHPGLDVRLGRAEALPFDDARFDCALAQLVLHFVSDHAKAAQEMQRVVRPGGLVAACVWDFEVGMEMLGLFWESALAVDPAAPTEARTLVFGQAGEIGAWMVASGLGDINEVALEVSSTYQDYDELWSSFLRGIGPAGAYCASLPAAQAAAVRGELFARLGEPSGPFTLGAKAWFASGRTPT